MLGKRDAKDSQNDIQAIGNMILECIDPKAFLQGGCLSDKWPSNVSTFVDATKVDCAKKLSKVYITHES